MDIFIASRYGDNPNIFDRMTDHLRLRYGVKNIFRDLTQSANALQRSNVILVVIGQQWLNDANLAGERLLENPNDPLHALLAQALHTKKLIVPLLVDGATMPSASQLPPDLAPLASKQAFVVRGDPYFHEDMLRVFIQINTALEWRPASWGTLAGTFTFIGALIAIVALDVVNNGVPTAGPLNGLIILCFFLALATFLATVAWAIRLTVKRQGWAWMATLIIALVLIFGLPIALAAANDHSPVANLSLLVGVSLTLAALLGVALFGPRKETTRARL